MSRKFVLTNGTHINMINMFNERERSISKEILDRSYGSINFLLITLIDQLITLLVD